MIASAQTLRELRPVTPFEERQKAYGMSYGLSSAGYDIRVAQDIYIPSGGFVLASSLEEFNMPNFLLGIVHDKSTLAREGLSVQNTVIEPNWKGYLTLEINNHGKYPFELQKGMPIAQIIFHILDHPTEQPYEGKYQYQQNRPQEALYERTNT